ncbi:MAG TPA: LuxR C-terminal-related transcriptional regulator [Chloroflexia bacterium]|nr:LuxR C-terminal-related transcriptional regulator [Chloroflexia bacterium]
MHPLRLLFITLHPSWADSFHEHCRKFSRPVEVIPFILESLTGLNFEIIPGLSIDLAVIATDQTPVELELVQALRDNHYNEPVLIYCSRFFFPDLAELEAGGVKGIVSSAASLKEIEQAIYAVADKEANLLQKQYRQAARALHRPLSSFDLTPGELETLRWVARDMTEEEIAEKTGLSRSAVSNRLRKICAKLEVKTRTGAVSRGIALGLVQPFPKIILACDSAKCLELSQKDFD